MSDFFLIIVSIEIQKPVLHVVLWDSEWQP